MEEPTKDLSDYLAALRRRKKQILTTSGILLLITVAVAFLLPPVYRSSATILIEEQEIPQELVRSTITTYADQRIQVISQQVMTRANLMQIIEKYNLYASKRQRETTEEILERMQKDIKLDMVSADVMDRVRGIKTTATIAFTLAYDGETAEGAQKVANELTSLYLNENLKNRQEQTKEASSFLTSEADKLGQYIAESEAKLADFKAKHKDSLPELVQLNQQLKDRAESEVMEVDRSITANEERKFYLEGQLAQIKPNSPMVSASGERILDTDERLKALEAQYASTSAIYSAKHPDVVKMRREIEGLKKGTEGSADSQETAKQLEGLRANLAEIRKKYSDDYPDVVKLKKSIAALEEAQRKAPVAATAPKKPENPAYLTMQAQLQNVESDLSTLKTKRAELKNKISTIETHLSETPQVEREYLELNRDHDNATHRYQEIKAKQMDAQVSQELEKDSKGERFSLIDPAQLPEKPAKPNRPMILLLGLVLSLGGGVGYAGLLESMDASVRGSKALVAAINAPLLGVIPYIENAQDKIQKSKGKKKLVISIITVIAIILLLEHFFLIPLDVLWFRAMRKLDM